MLKYFKKKKCRLNSLNENDHPRHDHNYCNKITADAQQVVNDIDVDYTQQSANDVGESVSRKRHSLRSTSSFCDEVFLEELANVNCILAYKFGAGGTDDEGVVGWGSDDDSISFGDFSLDPSIREAGAAVSDMNSIVGLDEDLFRYHSRLSMNIACVLNEPNCLSYFVQFLDTKNALPLIKFYLDTENFKKSALAQLRKEQKNKITSQQLLEKKGNTIYDYKQTSLNATQNNTDDQIHNKQHISGGRNLDTTSVENNKCKKIDDEVDNSISNCNQEVGNGDNRNVPELKTLCDLSMRKPLTDDEKSQIYAQTNKHLIINNTNNIKNHKFKTSSQLSLSSMTSNYSEVNEKNAVISLASIEDALAIYKKYLIQDAKQFLKLPLEILAKISLIICKRTGSDQEGDAENLSNATAITADCFLEAQKFVVKKMETEYLNDFLQSNYYVKYCLELIEGQNVSINDILHSEVTLFYFMEYLEQQLERECLDFWSTAINYRKSYNAANDYIAINLANNKNQAQSDAMIIYEKFFSLQNETKLWSSNKLRAHVEACICTEGMVYYCFDLPLKVAAKYLECKHLKAFLNSSIFANYVNELKSKLKENLADESGCLNTKSTAKMTLRRSTRDKTSNRQRKSLPDCSFDKRVTISQHNTLLAASTTSLKQFHLNIDSSQLTNPDLLWHRSNSNNLKFGRVNSLGRYERDFITPSDVSLCSSKLSQNWSISLNGKKLKNAMRKLVHLPEDNVQEEIAWQVAEMIVNDVTSVTLGKGQNSNTDEMQKIK